MVCPYRLVTTGITAVLSILYIRKTIAQSEDGDHPNATGKETGARKKFTWTPGTIAICVGLILLHVDLLVTGYLRHGAKDAFAWIYNAL